MDTKDKSIYLLDAYALIYRSYYAFIRAPRVTSKGENVSAVFGFLNTLVELLTKQSPDYIAVAFDTHAPTFRHNMYPLYKANRDEQPEGIRTAVPHIKRLLAALNIPVVECEGYEADDIIGTLAKRCEAEGFNVFMMTPDKDYAQLVSDKIKMYKPKSNGNEVEIWGVNEVCNHFSIKNVSQVIDILGLWGDSADNIPGCPGVGEKKAKELLSQFDNIDNIYQNIDQLKGKLRENLEAKKDQVILSRTLATICTEVPIDFDTSEAEFSEPNRDELITFLTEMEFRNVIQRIDSLFVKIPAVQGGLFDQPGLSGIDNAVPETSSFETAETTPHKYHLLTTGEQIDDLAKQLSQQSFFCFDTETTSVDAVDAEMVGLSVAWKEHESYYIAMPASRSEAKSLLDRLVPVFVNTETLKIGQNIKYDIMVLANYGVVVSGRLFDTMVAHFLLYPNAKHGMDAMAESLLKYKPIAIETLIGNKGATQGNMRNVELEKIKEYAAEDADITLQLYNRLNGEMAQSGFEKLFTEIEMPLVPVLADMEYTGVCIDSEALAAYGQTLNKKAIESEQIIKQLAGVDFNISSPKQVGEVLFEQLKIDVGAKKTKTGQYSTSEETLQKLAADNPIVAEILNYRGLLKLINTYVEALPKLVNKRTGRIHTSYNQTVVVTGRLSSSNPNLQNIPIRDENGRELRKAFIPSGADRVFLSADYSQVELRLMAHLSNDPHLIAAFRNGEDIHAATAAKIFKVPLDEVTSDMRRKAKTANFGIIYGISAFGLAERLNIQRKEAKELIDGYFESFPDVKIYMDRCIEDARKKGSVYTIFGRSRKLDDINSRNQVVRGVAERNAINAPIQGSAADIIKIAMVNIFNEISKRKLKSKMLLQVHDELNFDVPREELNEMKSLVKECMESACKLNVPLIADMGEGQNWLEAH